MLAFAPIAALPGITVTAVTCRQDRPEWSEVESPDRYRVVLVRRGRFRRRAASHGCAELDRTLAYVGTPAEEEYFAHPDGGDTCTLITVTPATWSTIAGDGQLQRSTFYVDAALDLAHRRLAASDNRDAEYALAEQVVGMLGQAVRTVAMGASPSEALSTAADERLAARARRVVDEGHPSARGLLPLAEHLGVSPCRLSRAFTRSMGVSLTRYRNRIRIGHALDRLEGGETGLAALAAELGFADQAHLSRTVREHLGHTPTALRSLLGEPRPGIGE